MKSRIYILLALSTLLAAPVLSSETNATKKVERPLTREELIKENAALKNALIKITAERDAAVSDINKLRALMFRMNQEFERLDQTDKNHKKK